MRRDGEACRGRRQEQGAQDRAGRARKDMVPMAQQQPGLVRHKSVGIRHAQVNACAYGYGRDDHSFFFLTSICM